MELLKETIEAVIPAKKMHEPQNGVIEANFGEHIRNYLEGLKRAIDTLDETQIQAVIEQLIDCYQRDGFVYIFGNGGSASTASHCVSDFNKEASLNLRRKFRFCCLNDNVPSVMAIANDIGYTQVFKSQLQSYLTPNDLVIGISGSGKSANVVEAIEYANSKDVITIALVGFDGGELKKIAKYFIHIPVDYMQYVEDVHLVLNHLIMTGLKNYLQKLSHDY
jgi:D-sedoheptulose 7-phosphate isomerase